MRISTTQMFQSGVAAMQRAQADLNHTSLQMATGRRILAPSDDPGGATQSVQLNAAINATEQYQRNGDYAQPRLEQEEAQVAAVENYLQRARELVLTANNDSYNQENRGYMASEIRQLRNDILGIANSKDANGEYLFAGTDSFEQPFVLDADNSVEYVGAEGIGAVRQVTITSTRSIAVSDTGKSVFMDIPEQTGKRLEGVMGLQNRGSLLVEDTGISDEELFEQTPEEVFTIHFSDNAGTMEYEIRDSKGDLVLDQDGNQMTGIQYQEDIPIEFAGRSLTLSGSPVDEDKVTSRPAPNVSIFDTLDDIATALEAPVMDEEGRELLSEAISTALLNIDSSLDKMNEIRTSVGLRLSDLETQTGLNDERIVDLRTTLSEVGDLDYAEAISRFKQQEVVLQAAQQTYVQVNKLSLFDFL